VSPPRGSSRARESPDWKYICRFFVRDGMRRAGKRGRSKVRKLLFFVEPAVGIEPTTC